MKRKRMKPFVGVDYEFRPFYGEKVIDHDQIALNSLIDEMFARDIKELIPKAMASAVPGVGWSASICTLDGERAFRITGQVTEADAWVLWCWGGGILTGEFVISQRVILDGEDEGKGWVKRCKDAVSEQMRAKIQ